MSISKKFLNSHYSFILALILGMVLAVGGSVWATSIGTSITVTGNLTTSSTSASSTVSYALGVSTTTPATTLSVGGNAYVTGGLGAGVISTTAGRILANVDLGVATTTPAQELSVVGDAYITLGLGVGIATTSAGTIENIGNVLFGDAAGDLVMSNSANWIFNNAGTTTIPSANANAWSYATSTANVPFLKFNTSTYRLGVGTTTPGATLAVGGDGTGIIMGGATSTLSIQSTNEAAPQRGGCIEVESAEGGGAVFRLYATSTNVPAVWESGSCR